MTISMYQVSVPVFTRNLNALAGVLDKAAAFAGSQEVRPGGAARHPSLPRHVSPRRPDRSGLHPLGARRRPIVGMPQPEFGAPETTIAALKERVTKTLDFVKTATAAQIDGTEDKDIVLKFGTAKCRSRARPSSSASPCQLLLPLHHGLQHPAQPRPSKSASATHGRALRRLASRAVILSRPRRPRGSTA